MCSTFKAPLAAAVLAGAEGGKFGLEGQISFAKADLLDYAPVVRKNVKRGRMSMEELAAAAVEVSDNSAANLLLPMVGGPEGLTRSEEHTSELQSLMRISYAVFCLKKKKNYKQQTSTHQVVQTH